MRPGRGNGVTGKNELQRLLGAYESWQPLCATRAGQQPELHLWQPYRGLGRGHPIIAAQGYFQPATECGAVDGRHDGLRAALHFGEHLVKARSLAFTTKFRNVRAGDERPAGAGEHHSLDVIIAEGLVHAIVQPLSDATGQGVYRWVVYGQQRDVAFLLVVNGPFHACPRLS